MPTEGHFIRLRVSDELWLTACRVCRTVLAFAPTTAALHIAEDAHTCPAPEPEQLEFPDAA
jgi:hypothetical protein